MSTLAIHAMYRLRVAYQRGAVSHADWLRRANRINARFGAAI